jgi:hypothetical protein
MLPLLRRLLVAIIVQAIIITSNASNILSLYQSIINSTIFSINISISYTIRT